MPYTYLRMHCKHSISRHALLQRKRSATSTDFSQCSNIVHSSLKTMSQLVNLMARIRAYAEESDMTSPDVWLQMAVMSLQTAREKTDDEEISRKLSFILEELELISSNKYSRHYSPELRDFSYLIQATSATAYETLLEQNFVCLPSVRTLNKSPDDLT